MAKRFTYQQRDPNEWRKRAAQNRGEGFLPGDLAIYQVRKGDNYIRIFPPTWDNAHHFGLDVWVHYGLGPDRKSCLCMKRMLNKPCPCCEAVNEFDRAGQEAEKKALIARRRVLVWLIDKKEEEKGPQLWAMPHTLDSDIAKHAEDPDSGEIYAVDDPERGYNISFITEGENQQRKYVGVNLSRKATSVDPKLIDFAVDNPLPSLLQYLSYEEALELYEGAPPDNTARGSDRRSDDSGSTDSSRRYPDPEEPDTRRGGWQQRRFTSQGPDPDEPTPRVGSGREARRDGPPPRNQQQDDDPPPYDDPPPRRGAPRNQQQDNDPSRYQARRAVLSPREEPSDPPTMSRADRLRNEYRGRREAT